MRMTKSKNNNSLTTTPSLSSESQTPIEIALQIDENGMTTASNLYAFLELHPAHFSDWCKRNIKNNKFATENEDYIVFTIESENPKIGGRPKTDYKITSEFAKKLSMTGNTEKHEQARQYFIACEQGLKIATKKLQDTTLQQNQFTQELVSAIKTVNDTLQSMNDRILKLEESQNSSKHPQQPAQNPQLPKKRFSYWTSKMFPKYQLLMDYFGISQYKDLYKQLYWELENTYPEIELNQLIDDYCYENHLDSCFTLDAIEHDKTVRKLFECIVDNLLKKYDLLSESNTVKHTTIFDN